MEFFPFKDRPDRELNEEGLDQFSHIKGEGVTAPPRFMQDPKGSIETGFLKGRYTKPVNYAIAVGDHRVHRVQRGSPGPPFESVID
jgi:hypothetical protein